MVPHPKGLLVLYTCLGGPELNSEIWLVNESPINIGISKMGNLLTEPVVQGEDVYFFEYSEFETETLWKFSDGKLSAIEIPANFKHSYIHDLAVLGDKIYFRYTNQETRDHGEGIFDSGFNILPKRDCEYFWKAATNDQMMIQKVKLAIGEVVELRTKDNQTPSVILRDRNADLTSPFKSLRNQFALNGDQWATIAQTDKGLTLIRGNGKNFTTEDLSGLFKDIQYWAPALAADGEVIFRATDMNGQFALWGYKDGQKRLIVGAGQEIAVETETVFTSPRSLLYNAPVFNQGKLFIGVGLRSTPVAADFGQGILEL
jgi:hypothetical protein